MTDLHSFISGESEKSWYASALFLQTRTPTFNPLRFQISALKKSNASLFAMAKFILHGDLFDELSEEKDFVFRSTGNARQKAVDYGPIKTR